MKVRVNISDNQLLLGFEQIELAKVSADDEVGRVRALRRARAKFERIIEILGTERELPTMEYAS